MPDNKVALFIDFDNIRIGIRQHFGGELHPVKLMNKASKYGRVTTAKAFADFTGHPKEFQDKLLFSAGIEPIHAPSKVSGGRRQSSADMHMVIDMFLEAIDHEDVDTFVLMTGDADFVRMVATLRRRFGRKVIISGVQSTSTSLDLLNAGDARDSITKADCDMTGELGRMSRPLVTRADLDAQEAAQAGQAQAQPSGILSRLFGRKQAPAAPASTESHRPGVPIAAAPVMAPPPRRLRASEVRGSSSPPSSTARGRAVAGTTPAPSPAPAAVRSAPAVTPRTTRSAPAGLELPPVSSTSRPDETEERIVREIFQMPPGRMGYTTVKTIEETLRSKAGQLGYTRKEVPSRLDRLQAMGLFKRESLPRGSGTVETGELLLDNPTVKELTQDLTRPEALPRTERAPRAPRTRRELGPDDEAERALEEHAQANAAPQEGTEAAGVTSPIAQAAPVAAPVEETPQLTPPPPATASEEPDSHFRWVSGGEPAEAVAADDAAPAAEDATKPRRMPRKAAAKPRATAAKPRATRAKAVKAESAERGGETATDPEPEPVPS